MSSYKIKKVHLYHGSFENTGRVTVTIYKHYLHRKASRECLIYIVSLLHHSLDACEIQTFSYRGKQRAVITTPVLTEHLSQNIYGEKK